MGLGEQPEELVATFKDLRDAGCGILAGPAPLAGGFHRDLPACTQIAVDSNAGSLEEQVIAEVVTGLLGSQGADHPAHDLPVRKIRDPP